MLESFDQGFKESEIWRLYDKDTVTYSVPPALSHGTVSLTFALTLSRLNSPLYKDINFFKVQEILLKKKLFVKLRIEGINMEIEMSEKNETNNFDIILRNDLISRINMYLGQEGLNIQNNDYCYIKIVGNHLEIGRAKIVMEE